MCQCNSSINSQFCNNCDPYGKPSQDCFDYGKPVDLCNTCSIVDYKYECNTNVFGNTENVVQSYSSKCNPVVNFDTSSFLTTSSFNSFTSSYYSDSASFDIRINSQSNSTLFTSDINVVLSSGKTFGKYVNGQTIPAIGKTANQVILDACLDYLMPSFNTFSISGQSSIIEVGSTLSGNKTFIWTSSNGSNFASGSILIRDVTNSVNLTTSLVNDGSEVVNIGNISNTVPIVQSWRIKGDSTNMDSILSPLYNVISIYPYFYGKVASGGGSAGANRPTSNQSLINSGNKVVADSNGTITVTYNSTSDDYIWFAIPMSSTTKTKWYVDALNNGNIGGAVSSGGNLFPTSDLIQINSPTSLWSNIYYKVFIANYQSAVGTIQFRNS